MLLRLLIASLFIPAAALGQQWKLIALMHHARAGNVLVFLNDGRLLAAGGGSNSSTEEPTSETYDPKADSWSEQGNLNTPRVNFPFVKLNDGRVMIPGGFVNGSSTTLNTTEIFDPVTNQWNYSTPLNQNREVNAAVTLLNGKVLIGIGGIGRTTTYFTSCELFDPVSKSMVFTGPTNQAQNSVFVLDSGSGNVLLFGGHEYGAGGIWYNEVEEYDTTTGIWNVVSHSQSSHDLFVRLGDGEWIGASGSSGPNIPSIVGVQAAPLVEIYNPLLKTWKTLGNLPIPRYGQGVVYIGNDSVLVGGGTDPISGRSLNDCQIINVKTGAISPGPQLNFNRATRFISQVFTDTTDQCTLITRVYAIGGVGTLSGSVDVFDSTLASCEMIEFRHTSSTGAAALTLPAPLSFISPTCSGFDTVITIPATGCGEIVIQSAGLLGFPNSYVATNLPDTLQAGMSKNYHLNFQPPTPGIETGVLAIHYTVNGTGFDTSVAIKADFPSRGIVKTVIRDILNAGDTVSLPIYLASESGDPMHGFGLSASFNSDFLTPIDPLFKGTLTNGAIVWSQNPTSTGLKLLVEHPFPVEDTAPLVILRFTTAVTKTKCTTLWVDTLQLFDSTGFRSAPCPLSVVTDSVTICLADFCGESTLRNFLNGTAPTFSVSYDHENDRIIIHDEIKAVHSVDILNVLGAVVKHSSTSGEDAYIEAAGLTSGIFIVRISDGERVYSQKILVAR